MVDVMFLENRRPLLGVQRLVARRYYSANSIAEALPSGLWRDLSSGAENIPCEDFRHQEYHSLFFS